jgi:hypothetical protein
MKLGYNRFGGNSTIKLKKNWKDFEKVVISNGIANLYHFTDYENLASIKKHGGLYSWDYCNCNNISIKRPGGDELSRDLDMRYDLENYVRLSFQQDPPLIYTFTKKGIIKTPVSLIIDSSVIYWENTKFSDENANSNEALIGSDLKDFEEIHFDKAMKSYNPLKDSEFKPFFQAEVLVKEHIPIKYIKKAVKMKLRKV